jgi:hypothetical protein
VLERDLDGGLGGLGGLGRGARGHAARGRQRRAGAGA